MNELFRTIHGSRLYGTHHIDSDFDSFIVVADNPTLKGRYARQSIKGTSDVVITDFSTFVRYAGNGVPQFVEAMFSRIPALDRISEYRAAFRPDSYKLEDTYLRTIRNFHEKGGLKFLRHSYRLTLNLIDFRNRGRFDPTLSDQQIHTLELMMYDLKDPFDYLA